MGELTPFTFDAQSVRAGARPDGEPCFVLADVCRALGHTNPTVALRMLDSDEYWTLPRSEALNLIKDLDPRVQSLTLISESGLYVLIMRSNVPNAKTFRRWVTHEVLPSIRKSGSFAATPRLPQNYADALRELAGEVEAREKAQRELEVAAPKAAYVDRFVDPEKDLLLFGTFAKSIGWREMDVRALLKRRKVIYRDRYNQWQCYARKPFVDWFYPKPQHEAPRLDDGTLRTTLVITAAGRLRLAEYLERHQ